MIGYLSGNAYKIFYDPTLAHSCTIGCSIIFVFSDGHVYLIYKLSQIEVLRPSLVHLTILHPNLAMSN
jgi:hypothetical protein